MQMVLNAVAKCKTTVINMLSFAEKSVLKIDVDLFKYSTTMLLVSYSIQLIKKIPWPEKYHKYTMRPEGAGACDYLSLKGKCSENTPGFPSGHCGTTSFFVISNIMYLLKSNY